MHQGQPIELGPCTEICNLDKVLNLQVKPAACSQSGAQSAPCAAAFPVCFPTCYRADLNLIGASSPHSPELGNPGIGVVQQDSPGTPCDLRCTYAPSIPLISSPGGPKLPGITAGQDRGLVPTRSLGHNPSTRGRPRTPARQAGKALVERDIANRRAAVYLPRIPPSS